MKQTAVGLGALTPVTKKGRKEAKRGLKKEEKERKLAS